MLAMKYHDKYLDAVSMKAAKRNIGETEESKYDGLLSLKDKLKSLENFNPRTDEDFLLRFLRVSKFDVKKAFERLFKYYGSHKKYPHIFDEYYPSAAYTSLTARHVCASPTQDNDNSAVIIHKRGLYDPSTMIYEHMLLLDTLIMDHLLENEVTQLCGVSVVLDFAGYSFQNFLQDTPGRLRMALDCFQNTFPLRFKEIHVINTPSIFSFMLKMAYPFLTKKIKNRLHIHDSNIDLLSAIPADILPEEYGGCVPKSDLVDIISEVIKKEDYYKDQLQYGYDKIS